MSKASDAKWEKVVKQLHYSCYEQGRAEGQQLIRSMYPQKDDGDDIIELALEDFPLDQVEQVDEFIDTATLDELKEFTKNFIDGVEDGVKSGLSRWLKRYNDSLE